MAEVDAPPAAPSAAEAPPATPPSAVDRAVASNDVAAFRAARLAERTGTPLDVPADSSPAAPGEQADAPAAPSAAPEKTPRADKRATEHRIPELLAERATLRARAEQAERELQELRTRSQPPPDAKPADSSPAAVPASFPDYDVYLTEHPDASYEAYLDARADWRADQRYAAKEREAQERARAERETQTVQERVKGFRDRVSEQLKADPEFLERLHPTVKGLKPFSSIRDPQGRWTERPTGYHAVAEELIGSEHSIALLRHFSDHPEELDALAALPPPQLLKKFGQFEATIGTGAATPAPPKLITDAPPPAQTLATHAGPAGDAIDQAVKTGDVAAYRAARLRERAAKLR